METNAKKVVDNKSQKGIDNNKKNAIENAKEKIKNSTSIFENADVINIEKIASKIKVSEKSEKALMYKFERTTTTTKEQKKLRQKIRNKRNYFADNIVLQFQKKNESELKKFVSQFDDFYKKEYILNDYSLLSLSSNNRDKDTEEKLNAMLQIIALVKSNK